MPAIIWNDPEKPKGQKATTGYENLGARGWTVTEEGLEAAVELRRQAAHDVQHWAALKPALGRLAKDFQREAQRLEKAATIWLRHFTDLGRKSILFMPAELAPELDLVFGAMSLATQPKDQTNDQ